MKITNKTMYNNIIKLFPIVLISCLIPGYQFTCSQTVKQLDDCGLQAMFFGNRDVVIPSNEAEMDHHCSDFKSGIKCMRDYAVSCVDGFPQQVMNMILTNFGLHLEKRCNKKPNRDEFMEHMKCLLPKEKKEPLDVCSDKHIKMMDIVKDVGSDDRISASCCTFQRFKNCIITESNNVCGAAASQYWDDIIQEVSDETVSFACTGFESLADCDKSMKPEVWAPLKAISDSSDPNAYQHNYQTMIPIALEMVKKYHMNS